MEKNPKEYFVPEEALKKVRDVSDTEGYEALSPEERLLFRKEKLAEFKRDLADFEMSFVNINIGLKKILTESDVFDRGHFEEFIQNQAEKYNIDPIRLREYKGILDKIEERAKTIQEYGNQFTGKENEFFEKCFGTKPLGKVGMEQGTVSISFFCSAVDFKRASKEKSDPSMMDANLSVDLEIPELNGAVILYNKEKSEADIKENKEHEERHVLDLLLADDAKRERIFSSVAKPALENYIFNLGNREIRKKSLESLLAALGENSLHSVKIEMLAYLKMAGNKPPADIFWGLEKQFMEGGAYDFFRPDDLKKIIPLRIIFFFDKNLFSETVDHAKNKYGQRVHGAIEVILKLFSAGFDSEKVTGMLQSSPLNQWQKVVSRLESSSEFRTNKTNKTKEALDACDHQISLLEAYIDGFRSAMQNPSKDSIYYQLWSFDKQKSLPAFKEMLDDKINEYLRNLEQAKKEKEKLELELSQLSK